MAPWKSINIYTLVSAEGLVVLENFAECSAVGFPFRTPYQNGHLSLLEQPYP